MDSPRGISGRIRAWRASVGSAIAGHPSGGHFAALASEPMLPSTAPDRPSPPSHARRAEGLLAIAGAAPRGMRDREAYAVLPLPPYASPARPAPPVERLLQLSEAARTAAALGWDVVSLAAPEERDVRLGDDLRAVAALLRDALAAAAGDGGAPERVLADAFAAFEELTYVLSEFETPPPPQASTSGVERQTMQTPLMPTQQMQPAAMPAPRLAPPPPASAREVPPSPAADTEKPLIEL